MAAMAMDMHFAGQREAALQLPVMTMEVKKKKSPEHCYPFHTLVVRRRNKKWHEVSRPGSDGKKCQYNRAWTSQKHESAPCLVLMFMRLYNSI